MTSAFIGEIRPFTYMFVPRGWLECNGTILPINGYQMLFALIGFTYGGDNRNNFAVPNLVGRTAMGAGQGTGLSPYPLGNQGGLMGVTLTGQQMPIHDHDFMEDFEKYASAPSSFKNTPTAGASYPSRYLQPTSATAANTFEAYATTLASPVPLASASLGAYPGVGGMHENRQPFTTLRYCICATEGDFPPFN